jgi:flagellar hook-associated protein FlgK
LTALNGTASSNVTIYDSLGKSYNASITYTNQGSNTWGYSISIPDTLAANTSVTNQVSYTFGSGETVNPGTNLTITGKTASGTATIVAPAVTSGEAVGSVGPPPTGYVSTLVAAISAAGITGVTVAKTGGILTITGATATSGSLIADPVASANSTGTLTFNASGTLVSPATNVGGIAFSGLSNGATALNLNWGLFATSGTANITQSALVSSQTAQSQNGSAGVLNNQTATNFFANFVSTLGATVSGVQSENTAENASVTQLQTQNNALSGVNLNDEAAVMSKMESTYQAGSQVFTMLNTIMAATLNLGDQTTVA